MLLWEPIAVSLPSDKSVPLGWILSSSLPEESFLLNGLLQRVHWFPFPLAGHGRIFHPGSSALNIIFLFVCLFVLASMISEDLVFLFHLLCCRLSGVHSTRRQPPCYPRCVSPLTGSSPSGWMNARYAGRSQAVPSVCEYPGTCWVPSSVCTS